MLRFSQKALWAIPLLSILLTGTKSFSMKIYNIDPMFTQYRASVVVADETNMHFRHTQPNDNNC